MRALIAFFSGLIVLMSPVLILAAYFGDKQSKVAKFLTVLGFVAALLFVGVVFF